MGDTNVVKLATRATTALATGGLSEVAGSAMKGRVPFGLSPASQAALLPVGKVLEKTGINRAIQGMNPFATPSLPGQPAAVTDPLEAERARVEAADKEQAKKRAKAIVSTVMTSPLGTSSGAPIQRSVLSSLGG